MPRRIPRPSPAMVVAMVALFLSLGGVSYGVATGFIDSREIKDNQVSSRDIRQNSIRTEDLRNNEVRGRDIRNSTIRTEEVALNTLTGSDINESSLSKVGTAGTADTAKSADSASAVATLKTIAPTTVAEGATVALATKGPFTVNGVCEATVGGNTTASLQIVTTETNSAITLTGGGDPASDPGDPNFGPGTLAVRNVEDTPGGDPQGTDVPAHGAFAAFAPGGAALTGEIFPWADASAGTGTCKFHGYAVLNG